MTLTVANTFGGNDCPSDRIYTTMAAIEDHLSKTDAPTDRPHEFLDATDLPPPEPLTETLESLADLEDDVVLVQENDRAPQHLYPKLEDRGYRYETIEDAEVVVTVIWREIQ